DSGGRTLVRPAERSTPPGGTTSVAASAETCLVPGRKTRVTQRVAAVPAVPRRVGGAGSIRCVGAFSSPESGVPMEAGSTLSRRSGREDAGGGSPTVSAETLLNPPSADECGPDARFGRWFPRCTMGLLHGPVGSDGRG